MTPLGTSKLVILAPSWDTFLAPCRGHFSTRFWSQIVSSELPRSACLSCLLPLVAARGRALPIGCARRSCGLLRAAAFCRLPLAAVTLLLPAACRTVVAACCRSSSFIAARRRLLPFAAACCRMPPRVAAAVHYAPPFGAICCCLLPLTAAWRRAPKLHPEFPDTLRRCLEGLLTSAPFPFHAKRGFENPLQMRTSV